jgi:hypothetical protein
MRRDMQKHKGWGQLEIHTRGLTVPVSTSALSTAEAIVTPSCSTHKIGERLRTTQSAVRSLAAITYVHGAEMRRLHVLRAFERGMQSLPRDAQRISPSGLAMLPRARARLVCYRNGGPRSIHSKCVDGVFQHGADEAWMACSNTERMRGDEGDEGNEH